MINFHSNQKPFSSKDGSQSERNYENPNDTTVVTQIKTELKDKIMLTWERFN